VSTMDMEILLVEDHPADVELPLRSLTANRIANHLTVARDGGEALSLQKPADFTELRDTVTRVGLSWFVVNAPPPASHVSQR